TARGGGQTGSASGAVSRQLQELGTLTRVSVGAARRVCRLPGGGRTSAQVVERRTGRHAGAAESVSRRMGTDRRTEVPFFHSPELPAQRRRLLLHAPAWQKRGQVVAPRQVRGPLRLSVLVRRAAGVHGNGVCREGAGEESVPVHQQSLLGEIGGQRRDDQTAARRAARRRVSAGIRRTFPRSQISGSGTRDE